MSRVGTKGGLLSSVVSVLDFSRFLFYFHSSPRSRSGTGRLSMIIASLVYLLSISVDRHLEMNTI
jgi:hypothetical protein